MVLESLINPVDAERRPVIMILYGFLYASISIILSLWIFRQYASLVMVFLTVLACIPLMYNTLRYEERKDLVATSEIKLLREHGKALTFFMYLFLGFVIAFVGFYVFMPAELAADVFEIQTETIQSINGRVTGYAAAENSGWSIFTKIFFNNLYVMMFCLLFSFFYGTGAMFILVWNASVIGAFIGSFIRVNFAQYAMMAGFPKIAGYFQVVVVGFAKLSLHGIPEILAYFVAGLAGGIISEAIVNHDLTTKSFDRIVLDSADLILIAIGLLFIGGLVEVWVSPALF